MDINVYQTVREKDGTISAYVLFKDSQGAKVKNICIQGKTQADFEEKIRLYKQNLDEEISNDSADMVIVQKAIDVVTTEVIK